MTGTPQKFDGPLGSANSTSVLLVAGQYDEARPETVQRQAVLLPGATYVEVAPASHLPQLERPEAYWSTVRRVLADA